MNPPILCDNFGPRLYFGNAPVRACGPEQGSDKGRREANELDGMIIGWYIVIVPWWDSLDGRAISPSYRARGAVYRQLTTERRIVELRASRGLAGSSDGTDLVELTAFCATAAEAIHIPISLGRRGSPTVEDRRRYDPNLPIHRQATVSNSNSVGVNFLYYLTFSIGTPARQFLFEPRSWVMVGKEIGCTQPHTAAHPFATTSTFLPHLLENMSRTQMNRR
ncbi:hypothetical protein K438DRAFT_1930754 [Mycena galopus ATCC 62051]|nr:hypothetical protein K438DRAFT_1930754 [Mycena galopus ATCC 62051]